MLINYWNCKYGNDAEEIDYIDTDNSKQSSWIYRCNNIINKTCLCDKLNNKWCSKEADCKLLDD